MKATGIEGGYMVRLERGDDVVEALKTLMRDEQIGCGAVTGLGAVDSARLGMYLVGEKSYIERSFEGEFEVVGLTGTLSWYEGEPFPHIHVMLADSGFQAVGGHCFAAQVSATIELYVRACAEPIERQMDDAVGLHLMQLD